MKGFLVLCLMGMGFAQICAPQSVPPKPPVEGNATWYPTESKRLSAAHAELPLGTRIRVTNLRNNKKVIVTITAHIPPASSRIIELAQEAAKNIGMNAAGPTPVSLEVLRGRWKMPQSPAVN